MIVSRSHNFIFVHIFKTAGTSIKRVLKRYDMPVWQPPLNEILKRVGVPQFRPRHYPDHLTASDLIEQSSLNEFRSLFSFAFVRNPWDWELSHYKYILRNKHHPDQQRVRRLQTFAQYALWRCDGNYRLQSNFTDYGGQQVVNFVGRYERLEGDFQSVCHRIGIHHRLPRLNSTSKTVYQHHYSDRTRDLIETTYRSDIERFNYSFEQQSSALLC